MADNKKTDSVKIEGSDISVEAYGGLKKEDFIAKAKELDLFHQEQYAGKKDQLIDIAFKKISEAYAANAKADADAKKAEAASPSA